MGDSAPQPCPAPRFQEKHPIWGKPHILEPRHAGLSQAGGARRAAPLHPFTPDPRTSQTRSRFRPRARRIPQRSRVSQEVMEADGAVRGVRLEVGRLVPQQQSRHGCSSRCDSRCLIPGVISGVRFPVCNSRCAIPGQVPALCACAAPPPAVT